MSKPRPITTVLDALTAARNLRSRAVLSHQKAANVRRGPMPTGRDGERLKGKADEHEGFGLVYYDKAKALTEHVRRVISRIAPEESVVQTREGEALLVTFRISMFIITFPDVGDVAVSTKTGKVMTGQRTRPKGLCRPLDMDATARAKTKRIFGESAPLIEKAEARALAARIGALNLKKSA